MTQATPAVGSVAPSRARPPERPLWTQGLYAATTWAAAAVVNEALPDVVPWGSDDLFTTLVSRGAVGFAVLALARPPSGRFREGIDYYGP
jgi:NitT/TauT family transport system permease protein